jgi:hypothetical protein
MEGDGLVVDFRPNFGRKEQKGVADGKGITWPDGSRWVKVQVHNYPNSNSNSNSKFRLSLNSSLSLCGNGSVHIREIARLVAAMFALLLVHRDLHPHQCFTQTSRYFRRCMTSTHHAHAAQVPPLAGVYSDPEHPDGLRVVSV